MQQKLVLKRLDKIGSTIVLLLFFCGCSSQEIELKQHLINLKERYPTISTSGWNILNYEQGPNTICFTLQRKNLDTIVFMESCKVLHDSIWNPGEEFYVITHYAKEYIMNEFKHILYGITDTNYHIKSPLEKPDSIIFISGKYFYQRRNGLLNRNQETFYINHSDSLDKLKGNDLPELPGK